MPDPDPVWREAVDELRRVGGPAARLLGAERLARWIGLGDLHAAYRSIEPGSEPFEARLLTSLGISRRIEAGERRRIPATGPLLVLANHPSGGAEALMAQALLTEVRQDWRVLGNRLLSLLPELRVRQLAVGRDAGDRATMLAAARHLAGGGCLLMFPAGTVAHWQRGHGYREAPWHASAARLARRTGAAVQPLWFAVDTTRRWRLLSAVSRTARTALLPSELVAQRGRTVRLRIPPPLGEPEAVAAFFASRPWDGAQPPPAA